MGGMNNMGMGGYLASQGRGGDTELAHVNPREKALLQAAGGSGGINPRTGLREFYTGGDAYFNSVNPNERLLQQLVSGYGGNYPQTESYAARSGSIEEFLGQKLGTSPTENFYNPDNTASLSGILNYKDLSGLDASVIGQTMREYNRQNNIPEMAKRGGDFGSLGDVFTSVTEPIQSFASENMKYIIPALATIATAGAGGAAGAAGSLGSSMGAVGGAAAATGTMAAANAAGKGWVAGDPGVDMAKDALIKGGLTAAGTYAAGSLGEYMAGADGGSGIGMADEGGGLFGEMYGVSPEATMSEAAIPSEGIGAKLFGGSGVTYSSPGVAAAGPTLTEQLGSMIPSPTTPFQTTLDQTSAAPMTAAEQFGTVPLEAADKMGDSLSGTGYQAPGPETTIMETLKNSVGLSETGGTAWPALATGGSSVAGGLLGAGTGTGTGLAGAASQLSSYAPLLSAMGLLGGSYLSGQSTADAQNQSTDKLIAAAKDATSQSQQFWKQNAFPSTNIMDAARRNAFAGMNAQAQLSQSNFLEGASARGIRGGGAITGGLSDIERERQRQYGTILNNLTQFENTPLFAPNMAPYNVPSQTSNASGAGSLYTSLASLGGLGTGASLYKYLYG
jgi:hypothetical protein